MPAVCDAGGCTLRDDTSMGTRSIRRLPDSRTHACNSSFALISAFVPGLPNTLLVQVVRSVFGKRPTYSLYAVYREGEMTFDATVRIDVTAPDMRLDELLRRFLRSKDFDLAVIRPIAARVRLHFGHE